MDKLYGDILAFRTRALEELRRAQRHATFVSLLSLDLSHLSSEKELQRFLGVGEFVKNLSSLVRGMIRDTDIMATARGSRVFILLSDTPSEGAEALSSRLQDDLKYFLCDNIRSPQNWRIHIDKYSFPGPPGEDSGFRRLLENLGKD